MPWKMSTIVVRVQAMTRTAPVYTVKWTSQLSWSNSHPGPTTPAPNVVSSAEPSSTMLTTTRPAHYLRQLGHEKATTIFGNFYVINGTIRLLAVALIFLYII